ncbi:TKL family protein kinase [Trichomonas vaginalis G3]|uniref:TKL family protein kinase n=1 Tax=Trichomonas vaginalis (strain ATCC PRA-98 / G3) TaxID=412133 RepID=A2DK06_TRIV3|nr:protein kinase protein [Trichomonas vaginalis G3]EAY19177.1 TKL family protein kinase [Trichomonas vaginalis G3]KAI5548460.1 protein kinase protein [Trichomonas vaginalis G3]|eukprot:XP_001580163.1 TKL family protein kinase [Trichomonas vaginalis G3]
MEDELVRRLEHLRPVEVRLDEFKILSTVGKGATCEVYQAHHLATGAVCAVKKFLSETFTAAEIHNFYREIKILSRARNYFLIPFYGISFSSPYIIAMKYIKRGSLHSAIFHKEGAPQLTPTNKTIIAFCIASGMQYLHEHDVIHRDLKSLNVLLDGKLYPHICDFGISRVKSDSDQLMTKMIGTPHWMAPEVFSSNDYTNKVDIYSFAILLWELISEERPYKGYSAPQLIAAVCTKNERPPIPKKCTTKLKNLLTQCWHKNPKLRPTFADIMDTIRNGKAYFPDTDESQMEEFFKLYDSDYFQKKGRMPSPFLKKQLKSANTESQIQKVKKPEDKNNFDEEVMEMPSFSISEDYNVRGKRKKLTKRAQSHMSIENDSNLQADDDESGSFFKNASETPLSFQMVPPSDFTDAQLGESVIEQKQEPTVKINKISTFELPEERNDKEIERIVSICTVKKTNSMTAMSTSLILPQFDNMDGLKPLESEIPESPFEEQIKPSFELEDPLNYTYPEREIPKPSVFMQPQPPKYDENGKLVNVFLEMENVQSPFSRSTFGSTNVDNLLDYKSPHFETLFNKTMWKLNKANCKDFFSIASLLFSPPIPLYICKFTLDSVLKLVEQNQNAWKPFSKSDAPENLPLHTPCLFDLSARLLLYAIPMNPNLMTVEKAKTILSMSKYKINQVLRIFSVYVSNLVYMDDPIPILETFLDISLHLIKLGGGLKLVRILYYLLKNSSKQIIEKFTDKITKIFGHLMFTNDLLLVANVYSCLIDLKLAIDIPTELLLVNLKFHDIRKYVIMYLTATESIYKVEKEVIIQIIDYCAKDEIAALLLAKISSNPTLSQVVCQKCIWLSENFSPNLENSLRIFCVNFTRQENRLKMINSNYFTEFMKRLVTSPDEKYLKFVNSLINRSFDLIGDELMPRLHKDKVMEKWISACYASKNEDIVYCFLKISRQVLSNDIYYEEYDDFIKNISYYFDAEGKYVEPVIDLLFVMSGNIKYLQLLKTIDLNKVFDMSFIPDKSRQSRDTILERISC